MATELTANGAIKVGANAVAEVTGYTLNYQAETAEDTNINDTARSYLATYKNYTMSVDVFYDQTDTTGQGGLDVGTSVTFSIYPSGETSGDIYYTGTAIVTAKNISGSTGDFIKATIELQGSGDLTESTVA